MTNQRQIAWKGVDIQAAASTVAAEMYEVLWPAKVLGQPDAWQQCDEVMVADESPVTKKRGGFSGQKGSPIGAASLRVYMPKMACPSNRGYFL